MPRSRADSPIDILFIGNSFTQRNDLPTLIAQTAAALPKPRVLQSQRIIANGASLRQHWNKGDALAAIQKDNWDYVVLQEQSTLPIKNAGRFHENVRLFDEEIKKSGAQTMLYLTWARQNAPETQTVLNDATRTIAHEIGALLAPVGPAWQAALTKDPMLELYDADGSHPSPAGTYLAACVFTTTLSGQSPVGLTAPDSAHLSEKQVASVQKAALQSTAWQMAATGLA